MVFLSIRRIKNRLLYYVLRMNFWENVEFELDKQGKYKKELAQAVGINASNFDKGKARNSIPAADTALKIARFLKVPLESLLEMDDDRAVVRPQVAALAQLLNRLSNADVQHLAYIAERLADR